ncbi:hypothetical protein Vadar_032227 [Vaccinium darrowii]|uniref:Uncharacterized protein n=1 Tax=Vaccinium darrowii TaxID=229202 RepID=A0ACB7X5K3_9ERIC|nr:hypothetical protein Vadar_032227 [Vaccinium darrowii]
MTKLLKPMDLRTQTQFDTSPIITSNIIQHRYLPHAFYHSSLRVASRSLRPRVNRRLKPPSKPVLNEAQFRHAVSQLSPRFTAEELCHVITLEEDPVVCLELFNWASQQPRFRHDVSTYHITIKKLAVAKLYQELDEVVNKVLDVSHIGSEALFNTIIYFFTEDRKLTKAVNIYKHMRNSRNVEWRTQNARDFYNEMKKRGFVPSSKSYNSLVNSLALGGEVDEAINLLWEMSKYQRSADLITYQTLLDEICRH